MDGGYDDSDRFERRGSDRTLRTVLMQIALMQTRFDALEQKLGYTTEIGKARKRLGAELKGRKAERAAAEAEFLAQVQAIVAKQDEELLDLIREDDEALDAAELAP